MSSKIKINNNVITIQPLLIFQRICLNINEKTNMKHFLQFELAPFPLAIFDEAGMRKTNKSAFCDHFNSLTDCPVNSPFIHVIDGGFLIHQIDWQKNVSIDDIICKYVNYVKNNFVINSYIVFDGYDGDKGTKSAERLRRQSGYIGHEIKFDYNTKITVKPKDFLSDEKNKNNLIKLLIRRLNEQGYRTKQADEDADWLIIQTALEAARYESNVIIVGNDTDLLVLFNHLAVE